MSKTGTRIRNMTTISLCLAVLCASSFIVVPLPFTPIVLSLHTVVVNLIALVLSPKHTFSVMITYLIMGLLGLPVFSGGSAGPDKLFGPTGGFYFGFLLSAVLISMLKGKTPIFKRYLFLTTLIAIPIQHVFAVLFMCLHNNFNVMAAFVSVSLPFIATDTVKGIVSAFTGLELVKILSKRN